MSKELTLNTHVPAPANLDDLQRVAKLMVASGFFKSTPDIAKACVKIMAGQELGISPVQSLMCIHFVNAKLAYEAVLLSSAIKRRGYSFRPLKQSEEECSIEFFDQAKESLGVASFTINEAKRAGLVGKDNWKNYPGDMLWARAMSRGCRRFCTDIFGGSVYVPEELGAEVDQHGRPVLELHAEALRAMPVQSEETQKFTEKLKAAGKPNGEAKPVEKPLFELADTQTDEYADTND